MAFRAVVTGLILLFSLFSPAHAVVPELRQPAWAELTQEQKQILAPLSRDWDKMEAFRKKQWLGIAKRYPAMKPEEQARIQRRMQDWVSLTPEQRAQARIQYKNLKTAPPEKKQAIRQKWEQYKELPDEEKKRLAEKAARDAKKAGMAKPLGLAPKQPPTVSQPLPTAAAPQPMPQPAPIPALPPTQAEAAMPQAEATTPPTQAETPGNTETPNPPATSVTTVSPASPQ
jgi:hypothetical protein